MDARTPRAWLRRLALDRPELRAWALYDWANSALFTVVITALFPLFFAAVAADALDADARRRAFGAATTIAMLGIAALSPLLGALADFTRMKKRMLGLFVALGVAATALLCTVEQGDWTLALVLFGLANVGAAGSLVFYDALLPHVARDDEADQLSTSGYALGYLGGGVCLALCIALVQHPAWFGLGRLDEGGQAGAASWPVRLSFLLVALWWALFSLPLFRRVSEPELCIEADERAQARPLRAAFGRLGETLRELRAHRDAFLMMLAFLVYNDGIGTIIRMAVLFGEERRIDTSLMITAILLVQFVGLPFTLLFGALARSIGPKRSILITLAVYAGITLLAWRMDSAREFVVLAVLVGTVQGGAQALSRSLFASMIPRHKSAEFFGFFSTLEKFSGVLGPLLFTVMPTGAMALGSLIAFFAVGALLLTRVDVARGRASARAAEAGLPSASLGT